MRKTCIFAKSMFALIGLAGCFAANAQEEIDVLSLSVSYTYPNDSAVYAMRAIDSHGSLVGYGGTGTYSLYNLFTCSPCNIPNAFDSNGFRGGVVFRWASESYAFITLTESESDPIVVSPRYTWKPRSFIINGHSAIRGRVQVKDRFENVVAYDNDVVLQGDFTSLFWLLYIDHFGRLITFRQIDYRLDKPLN